MRCGGGGLVGGESGGGAGFAGAGTSIGGGFFAFTAGSVSFRGEGAGDCDGFTIGPLDDFLSEDPLELEGAGD